MMLKNIIFILTLFIINSGYAAESNEGLFKPTKPNEPIELNYYYQFNIKHIQGLKPESVGLIEYVNNGELLYNKSIKINPSIADENLISLPDPLTLSLAFDQVVNTQINIYVGDLLTDYFDLKTFDQYQRGLQPSFGVQAKIDCNQDTCELPDPCRFGFPDDCDRDGVVDSVDNCMFTSNANQADCDNDGRGNVCDSANSLYQRSGGEHTCTIDKDRHLFNYSLEHFVEQYWIDVSSCGAPPKYTNRIAKEKSCSYSQSEETCCRNKLYTSILSFGDNADLWCFFANALDDCH